MNKLRITLPLLFLSGVLVFAQNTGVNGEMVLRAIQKSFPQRVSAVAFAGNDWTITAGGEIFYWAGGRLLPVAEKDNADSYGPHLFYTIPAKPASPDSLFIWLAMRISRSIS